jgi:cytochrome c peroxidase
MSCSGQHVGDMRARYLQSVGAAVWAASALSAMGQDDAQILKNAKVIFKPVPAGPVEIKDNPASPEREELGKMLFFEPRLSKGGTISCNTCHNLSTGGDDNLPTSVGHGWQKGPRNSPTVYNAVFNIAQFWDGRAEDLKAQAKGPIQAGVEMANTPEAVVTTLKSMPEYVERFGKAFPGEQDPVTFDNMARAIEIFEATLVTPGSRFDQYLEGDEEALNANERAGLRHFMTKGCVACHSGVNLGGQGYFPFGVLKKPTADILPVGDKGRFAVTNTEADSYVFRAAPLRNVELTGPYFHSGQVWTLEEAVEIMSDSQLGGVLTTSEIKEVAAFLRTLTGKLPEVTLPQLPPETPATPQPQP